jgi:hypothetical protein
MLNLKQFMPSMKGGLLTNVWVLYFVLAMTVFELYNYTFMRMDYTAVAIFFLVGLVISVFSKNMTVIMILAVALTRLVVYGKNLEGFKGKGKNEGFEGDEEEEDTEEGFEGEEEEEEKEETVEETVEEDKEGFEKDSSLETSVKPASSEDLLKSQQEIIKSMKSLEPILAKAESFLAADQKEKFTLISSAAKYE